MKLKNITHLPLIQLLYLTTVLEFIACAFSSSTVKIYNFRINDHMMVYIALYNYFLYALELQAMLYNHTIYIGTLQSRSC